MPKRHELPLPRPKYGHRLLHEIRGHPKFQIRPKDKHEAGPRWRAAYDRRRKMKAKIEKDIDEKARELQALDRKIEDREKLFELASKAPSVKEMRAAVMSLFKEEDLNPIKELIKLAKSGSLTDKEKAVILKELAQYMAAKPKSVDIQADHNMNVTVGMVDFRNTSKATVDASKPELTDESYDEFMDSEEI